MDYLAAMRAFVRSADLGSFSKAAAESGAKISTVSRHISALEADLGAALLNRSTRRIALTEAGRAFYERAVLIVAEVEDARRMTSALNSRPRGLLRLNLPGAFGRLHVMPAVPGFLTAHPDIRIEVGFSDARVDLIETSTDLVIRIGSLTDSGLTAKRLASHHRLLCAAPQVLSRLPNLEQPTGLSAVECLSMAPKERWHFRPSTGPAAAPAQDLVSVSGKLCTSDLQALRVSVLSGLGVALLPAWLVGADIAAGRLVRVLSGWDFSVTDDFDQAIWALYPPKKIVSPKVRAFMDYLQGHLADTLSTPQPGSIADRRLRAPTKKNPR
ncbi:MAG TPA: LysR family transcriptional regulator [Geobacterales bacterium]|nr:LysR family transcriptional regulator [Geobacterales bacterium]